MKHTLNREVHPTRLDNAYHYNYNNLSVVIANSSQTLGVGLFCRSDAGIWPIPAHKFARFMASNKGLDATALFRLIKYTGLAW